MWLLQPLSCYRLAGFAFCAFVCSRCPHNPSTVSSLSVAPPTATTAPAAIAGTQSPLRSCHDPVSKLVGWLADSWVIRRSGGA
jgi:hypothetical protein